MDNNALMLEMKNSLNFMCRDVTFNKISFNEFASWFKVLVRYISLGAKDYFSYVESLNGACVIIKDTNELAIFNECTKKLKAILLINQSKSDKIRK